MYVYTQPYELPIISCPVKRWLLQNFCFPRNRKRAMIGFCCYTLEDLSTFFGKLPHEISCILLNILEMHDRKVEDIKVVIRSCKLKGRQYNGQTKKDKSTKHYAEI